MRIVIGIATMELGGAERQVSYLARGFVRAGHQVNVVLMRGGANFSRLVDSGASISMIPRHRMGLIAPVVYQLRCIRPDVAYMWQRPFDIIGGLAAWMLDIPCIHAERTAPDCIPAKGYLAMRRAVVRLSSGVIANSEEGKAHWRKHLRPDTLVEHIPNMVPSEELSKVVPSPESAGALVAVGRLDEGKNVMTLLRAVARLQREGTPCPVLVVGDGPCRAQLSEFIRANALDSVVTLCGPRTDVWALMKGSRAFVSLSRFEGSPNAVIEAAMLGVPLFLSDIAAHRSITSNGHFVDTSSEDAVVNGIRQLCEYRNDIQQAPAGIGRAGNGIDTPDVIEQHLTLFRRVTKIRGLG